VIVGSAPAPGAALRGPLNIGHEILTGHKSWRKISAECGRKTIKLSGRIKCGLVEIQLVDTRLTGSFHIFSERRNIKRINSNLTN
jgi:hypothetical protein